MDRMNGIPKYVASTTLREANWNATVIEGDVAAFVADLKEEPGGNINKSCSPRSPSDGPNTCLRASRPPRT